MKAKIINGVIVKKLPKYYKNWIGNFHLQSTEIHESEGFYDIIVPIIDDNTQEFGEIYFDEGYKIFTYHVISKLQPTLAEAKIIKIYELKSAVRDLYSVVQGYITEKQIYGETVPTEIRDKIKSIRTKYQNVKGQINALTTVVNVLKFQIPYDQINTLKNELLDIE